MEIVISTNKNVTATGTAEPLTSTGVYVSSVTVKAKSANTGDIYIGGSSVDSTGFKLGAGQAVTFGDQEVSGEDTIFNLENIYIDSSVSGEGVEILGNKR